MSEVPDMKFGHIGINVTDMEPMVKFYTEVLDFRITDRGVAQRSGTGLVFLSRNADEHHQILLATGRDPAHASTLNQMSFRVEAFEQVRVMYDRAVAAGVDEIAPIDHGAALSVYFPDPEGNRVEVYWATPWYIVQPHAMPLDFSASDDEIIQACEDKCRADPTFKPMAEWQAEFSRA